MSLGSLRTRLLLAGALAITIALLVSAIGLLLLFERHVTRRIDTELGAHLNQLVAGLDRAGDGETAIVLLRRPAEPRFEQPLSGLYWQIVIEPGQHVLRSRSLWDGELALPADDLGDGAVHRHDIVGPGGTTLHVLEREAELPERLGAARARVAVAIDAVEIARASVAFAHDLALPLALLGALLLLAGWVQVTIGLRPLDRIGAALSAVRAGSSRRLGRAFPDEVRPLAGEIDALLDARDADLERARGRAADLAHGLKTPLQVLLGEAERLRSHGDERAADVVASLAEAMQRHVERELRRARLASGSDAATADIGEVVRRVVGVIRRTPAGDRLEWAIDIPAGLAARIDRDDLAEAIGNLLENAADFARHRVAISASADPAIVTVVVMDDGAGIPEADIAEALKRGRRLDTTRGGAGLGLAIVRDIADNAMGTLSIENAMPGLKATLRLKRA
ncbi:MAG: HAMP domain-containing sensor histidine kinase [Pseudomonadota bacterium]